MNKYGTTEIKSRFKVATEAEEERKEEAKRRQIMYEERRKNAEIIKQKAKIIKSLNNDLDFDDHWLQVNLDDGRVGIYKDGKMYDLDTRLPIEL
jgi:hypothetical protein